MTTAAAMSWRERRRTATMLEIKDTARRLLVDGGTDAVSLRAIAREMGLTAPAIYRYFASLDTLVAAVAGDLCTELRATMIAARDAEGAEPAARLLATARAFRRWSISNRAEFGLLFGGPVASPTAPDNPTRRATRAAAARIGATLLGSVDARWAARPFRPPPVEQVEAPIGGRLQAYRRTYGTALPSEVVHAFLSGWVRLYGVVAMEVFGHLLWAIDDAEALFERELELFLDQVTPD